MSMLHYEREAWATYPHVAGLDEAGRGPLAGPVVAAAVVFDPPWIEEHATTSVQGLTDSKKLTPTQREYYCSLLNESIDSVRIGIGVIEADEIDHLNILRATHQAMANALQHLPGKLPPFALVDGLPVKHLPIPHRAIVQGDGKSLSIAAASVVAKVTRDRLMEKYAEQYPEYGFAQHKGYGTKTHLTALKRYGPCPIHRRSFSPVSQGSLF